MKMMFENQIKYWHHCIRRTYGVPFFNRHFEFMPATLSPPARGSTYLDQATNPGRFELVSTTEPFSVFTINIPRQNTQPVTMRVNDSFKTKNMKRTPVKDSLRGLITTRMHHPMGKKPLANGYFPF